MNNEGKNYVIMLFLGMFVMFLVQKFVAPAHAEMGITGAANKMAESLDKIEKKLPFCK